MKATTQTEDDRRAREEARLEQEATTREMVIHIPPVPYIPTLRVQVVSRDPGQVLSGKTGRVLWLGGVTAVAALGVVEWPVAALVAAGAWVAEQYAKQDQQAEQGERPQVKQGHQPRQ